ncbi:hypothetical protein G7Z17_g11720 [Cylindrodendrum hubeiense]|uniref:RRM domain-containing protein n=1 Tax=Cylindrodendrum hubeiense TaxID=595255 RepID=A0A9P5H4J3_9HYPO|nr:hypothetical protein G7Z17_g11720 [Cylindrodendrum hubeiense]
MADKMDRGLDEIIADTRSSSNNNNNNSNNNGPRNRRGGGRRREPRPDYPRDGVKKSFRDDSRNLDRGPAAPRRRRESPEHDSKGSKVRVDNIHYDLTEDDLDELFKRIGPVARLQLRYDRAGRSEGTAYVTYEQKEDAQEAVRQFDGANANGQPIRLTLLPSGPARNPFDTAVMPGRPLADRISAPGDRTRSLSPHRRIDDEDATRKGIDRYVPGQGSRSRSPMPRRQRGGRRPGARRDNRDNRDNNREGGKDQEGGRGGRGNPRGKKTQEELDAEMADYFGGSAAAPDASNTAAAPAQAQAEAQAPVDDMDMIE